MLSPLLDVITPDWFTEWPAEALKGVAMAMMTETDLELGGALEGIVEMFRCHILPYDHLLLVVQGTRKDGGLREAVRSLRVCEK